ncbi:MAG: phosphatase PAP2 family protein, partial [Thermoplasmata archaeon]|nr:phosphatase PAP2 family protein [Thermoplasmata archaeon]
MALSNDHQLTLRQQVALVVVITVIILVGILLYAAGYNESFYSGNPQVRSVFEALTNLGTDALYLAILTLIYLSYDKRFGRRLCYVFFFMVYVTDFLKEFFQDPRPPANLEREDPYTSYGFPSGHTTTAITFYGYIMLSHLGDRRWRLPLIILCLFPIIVVPISRMVIGVHDLQDVVGGAVIALSILLAYMVFLPRAALVVKAWSMERQIGVGVTVALLLWVIG